MQFYETNRQRLIINADDFGISPRANRNILYLISLGKIDRVGMMVHGQFLAVELDTLLKSGVKLDVHLDILHEFHDKRRARSGALGRILEFGWKFLSGQISPRKIKADWRKQILLFQKITGKNPDGLNSHEHVHFFPLFFRIILDLGEEFSIPYVRFGENTPKNFPSLVAKILAVLRKIDRKKFKASRSVSSGSLISLDWLQDIDNFLDNLPTGTVEIACHPELAEDFVSIKKYF